MAEIPRIIQKSKSNLVVLVFSANWLGTAVVLDSFMEYFSKKFRKIRFYRVDMDTADGAAEKFGINTVPTTLFFRKEEIVEHFTGVPPKQKIEQWLQKF